MLALRLRRRISLVILIVLMTSSKCWSKDNPADLNDIPSDQLVVQALKLMNADIRSLSERQSQLEAELSDRRMIVVRTVGITVAICAPTMIVTGILIGVKR